MMSDAGGGRTALTRRGRSVVGVVGVAASVSLVVGVGLFGSLPDDDDGGVKLARYITDHRAAVLAASVVLAASSALNVAFWVVVRRWLATRDRPSAATDVGASAAVVAFTMFATGAASLQVAGYLAGRHGGLASDQATLLIMVFTASTNLSSAAATILGLTFGVAFLNHRDLPRWWGVSLLVVGVLQVTALVSVASKGVFAATGAMPYLGPAVYALWLLVVPGVLVLTGGRSTRDALTT